MAARTHSTDPRAERVRALLLEAAFSLAHERRVDDITVADLVTEAGVSRQVFISFADRDDAVAMAITAAFAAATEGVDREPRARILGVFDAAAEHRSVYRHVVGSGVTQRVVAAFREELLPACEAMVEDAMPVIGSISSLQPDAVSRFLVGGFQEVLRSWMEDPQPTDLRQRVVAALDTVDALLGTLD